jgi:hypothetical protein
MLTYSNDYIKTIHEATNYVNTLIQNNQPITSHNLYVDIFEGKDNTSTNRDVILQKTSTKKVNTSNITKPDELVFDAYVNDKNLSHCVISVYFPYDNLDIYIGSIIAE